MDMSTKLVDRDRLVEVLSRQPLVQSGYVRLPISDRSTFARLTGAPQKLCDRL